MFNAYSKSRTRDEHTFFYYLSLYHLMHTLYAFECVYGKIIGRRGASDKDQVASETEKKRKKKMSGNKRRGLAPQFMKGKDAEKEIEIKIEWNGKSCSERVYFHHIPYHYFSLYDKSNRIEDGNNIDRVKCHN